MCSADSNYRHQIKRLRFAQKWRQDGVTLFRKKGYNIPLVSRRSEEYKKPGTKKIYRHKYFPEHRHSIKNRIYFKNVLIFGVLYEVGFMMQFGVVIVIFSHIDFSRRKHFRLNPETRRHSSVQRKKVHERFFAIFLP